MNTILFDAKPPQLSLRRLAGGHRLPNLHLMHCWLVCLFLMLCSGAANAQQVNAVKGTVADANGQPLSDVTVRVSKSGAASKTDAQGAFSINLAVGDQVSFSLIGFVTQQINYLQPGALRVILQQDQTQIEEVVVVGYGTQKKTQVTGAVSSIQSKEITTTKNESVVNMLTGKIGGLRVTQNSSEPGAFDNSFDIRGMGTPLIIIDGVPRSDISRLNSNDIESISVLKDASAAIYGVRAANGVILVTTKKGSSGAVRLNYNGMFGIQTPSRLPKPVGIFDYMTLVNEQRMHNINGGTPIYTEADFEAYRNGSRVAANWQDAIIRDIAPQTEHNINMNGGTEKTSYFASLGYSSQSGIFKSDDVKYKRFNLRSNVTSRINDHLKLDLNIAGMSDQKDQPYISPWYVFRSLWYQPPVQNIYANNNPNYFNNVPSNLNGVAHADADVNGYMNLRKKSFQSSVALSYQVPHVKGLELKALGSYDFDLQSNKIYMKSYNLYNYDAANDKYNPVAQQSPATIRNESAENPMYMYQLSANYQVRLADKHNISGLLLYEKYNRKGDNFYAQRELSLPVDQLLAGNSLNQQAYLDPNNLYETENAAFVGRVNYDFMGKYMMEFAFRQDGTSKFSPDRQWGFFPVVSAGYRISEESFWKNSSSLSFINSFKLRSSYGVLGDENASSYQFISGYNYPAGGSSTGLPGGAVFDGKFVSGAVSKGLPNPFISWYKSKTFNVGADFELWNGQIGGTVDYFVRNRSGLLATQSLTLPDVVGVGLPQQNLNGDRTRGIDMELFFKQRRGDLSYQVKGILGYTRTMNTTRAQAKAGNSYLNWNNSSFTQDRWNNIYWGYGAAGQYQSYQDIINSGMYVPRNTVVGDYIYEDWNGDGQISTMDNQPIATAGMPMLTYGFTFSMQYKNFDFNMHWNGSGGVYVSYSEQLNRPLWAGGGALEQFMDRWHPKDPMADPYHPDTEWVPGNFAYTGSVPFENTMHNASSSAYLRLKNAEIGYTLPEEMIKRVGINGLRFYVNGYNLLTFTNLRYLDPEHPSRQWGYLYPLDKKFIFGVNLTL